MGSERGKRFEELLAGALRIDPERRDAWLRAASRGDERLRVEVSGFLALEAAIRDELRASETEDRTRSWPADRDGGEAGGEVHGFSPRAAIAAGDGSRPVSEAESVTRARLRELPMIYILTVAMAGFWRATMLGDDDRVLRSIDLAVIAGLGAVAVLLWSPRRVALRGLRALELGMVAVLAARLVVVEYQLVLFFSLREDPMMAQFVTKNVVLLCSILIPAYGLHVPKGWRRAAVVVVPLALLPFATLAALFLQHPAAMAWLGRGVGASGVPRFLLFSFDALILLVLAVASTVGARAISRMRRQIAEARHLGQYRLGRRIGSGGMGEVYLAEHQLLKRPCALKLIRPDSVADPRSLARFEREVRLTAALSHPNTVEIYDYGRTEQGTYYYVMEYLPGLSLAELVERHGPLPAGRVVHLLRQVCWALREAHAAGLIHRDIKPSNIFVSRRGGIDDVAKLLDFGLVMPLARPDVPELSGERQVLGTPLFMSPEQAAGGDLDGRSDIYSLGAVAYYLLTGRPPFDEADGLRTLIAHARDPVVPPSLVRDDVPDDLERVVLRCLAKAPAARFPDARSLDRALAGCACAGEWDRDRAARWWRDAGDRPARPAEMHAIDGGSTATFG